VAWHRPSSATAGKSIAKRALHIDGDSDVQTVFTRGGKIEAKSVVVATNTPFNDRVVMHTKQAGYRTYVIGMRVPKGSVPRMLLWDTGDPYYYVRLETPASAADHDILVVGGADHKVGQDTHPEHRYDEIEQWVREHFPMAQAVEYRWSGEIMKPSDGVAYLGRNPMDDRNVYIITGDSGNGMTHCTLGAMLVSDLIVGRGNPWEAIYDPYRGQTPSDSIYAYGIGFGHALDACAVHCIARIDQQSIDLGQQLHPGLSPAPNFPSSAGCARPFPSRLPAWHCRLPGKSPGSYSRIQRCTKSGSPVTLLH
jgi:hypothetical protein